ncbi:MAG TPA: long-chain fatty acid--CoA ligase [Candidatus Corynebacterium avicola]|uniref:Long-chain fatty acid--CoA ligase n=1 Tax=Candidatus Corynebacterium avicola TaxID=2838527 RepID=A0A9D1UMB2_9CORY|nr:long-chain fatty acid--CoA ligase [Candidatus Corynebacterium avicola]
MSFNLATILEEPARTSGSRPLLRLPDRTLNYAQVDREAGRVAAGLLELGLEPGDRVAVQLPNTAEFVFSYFGVVKAGLVMVPLNPQLTSREIAYHLGDSGARVLITGGKALNEARHARAEDPALADVSLYTVDDVPGGAAPEPAEPVEGVVDFGRLLADAPLALSRATDADDTVILLYTSGTTGRPKGAKLTHSQMYMNCTVGGELFDVTERDIMFGVLPLFHVFGLSSVLNIAVRYGASLVLQEQFDARTVIETIESVGVTVFHGVPTMYGALTEAYDGAHDMSTLRTAISGGAAMPEGVMRSFEERFNGVAVLEGYGLSETASVASFNISREERRPLSIGKPIWGTRMAILDSDDNELPDGPGNIGEVVVRGHNVMKGYHQNPEATAKAVRDGWFHTGDLGYRDEDGFFYIVDRLKDLILRGGYNVYPREIEEVLYSHPDVSEVAVVGRPDERLGEEVHAFVALTDHQAVTEEDLKAYCKERLAAYKYPRQIHLMGEIPKGATGKILKRELPVE